MDVSLNKEKKSALIVDGDAEAAKQLKAELEQAGFQVITAADGQKAMLLVDSQPRLWYPDLIFVDVIIPQLSAFEVTRRLSNKYDKNKSPIIITSKHNSPEDRLEADNAGASGYLAKPVAISAIEGLYEQWREKKVKSEVNQNTFKINYD